MDSNFVPSDRSSGPNTLGRTASYTRSAARSTTVPSQPWSGTDGMRYNTSDSMSDRNRPQAPRQERSSYAPSTLPSLENWLHKLPSTTSGYSVAGPPSLNNLDAQSEGHSTTGLHPAPSRSAQPFQSSQPDRHDHPLRNAGVSQAPQLTTVLQDMPREVTGSTGGRQADPTSWEDQQRTEQGRSISGRSINQQASMAKTQRQSLSQQPINQPQPMFRGQPPVVNNYHYNYNPVDSRQNVTTNNQKYHFDSGFHQATYTPTQNHTYNNQHHNIDNSARDRITQSMESIHIGSSFAPRKSYYEDKRRDRAPSEDIPLRGVSVKCKRGLFIGKTISTRQHVVDDRPCITGLNSAPVRNILRTNTALVMVNGEDSGNSVFEGDDRREGRGGVNASGEMEAVGRDLGRVAVVRDGG